MEHLIIDCDPGVDDALALMMALASDQVVVDRITTVDGNVSLDHVARNAATVLELVGRTDVPLHRGADRPLEREPMPASRAHGGDGLGDAGYASENPREDPRDAVEVLLAESAASPDGITILALGPLTNLALAVRQDPTFPQRVRRLVIMGGAEFTGNVTPSAEFNILHDPEAAEVVFAAGFPPIEMIGLDATRQVFMSPGIRELIRQLGGTTGRFVHDVTEKYVDHYWRRYREVGAELCDPLAFAHLIDPELVDLVPARVEIATSGVCDGRTVVWRTSRYRDQEPNALVATSVDARRFFDALLGSLFPEHTAEIAHVLDRELPVGGPR